MLDFLNELFQGLCEVFMSPPKHHHHQIVSLPTAHPELQGRDLFITGESYAGHYVPAVSARIFRANQDKEAWVKACLNLKGFAIGTQ